MFTMEIFLEIFSHMTFKEVVNLRLISSNFKNLVDQNTIRKLLRLLGYSSIVKLIPFFDKHCSICHVLGSGRLYNLNTTASFNSLACKECLLKKVRMVSGNTSNSSSWGRLIHPTLFVGSDSLDTNCLVWVMYGNDPKNTFLQLKRKKETRIATVKARRLADRKKFIIKKLRYSDLSRYSGNVLVSQYIHTGKPSYIKIVERLKRLDWFIEELGEDGGDICTRFVNGSVTKRQARNIFCRQMVIMDKMDVKYLQSLDNNTLATLLEKNRLSNKVSSFPYVWSQDDRNQVIVALSKISQVKVVEKEKEEEKSAVASPSPVCVVASVGQLYATLRDANVNAKFMRKNFNLWTPEDLDSARAVATSLGV